MSFRAIWDNMPAEKRLAYNQGRLASLTAKHEEAVAFIGQCQAAGIDVPAFVEEQAKQFASLIKGCRRAEERIRTTGK